MKRVLSILLLLAIYLNCYAQPSKYKLDENLLGSLPNQKNTKTCVGWSIVYGLLSYDRNINLKNKDSISFFNPCYNFTNDNCSKEGTNTDEILKSIWKKGLTFLPKHPLEQNSLCNCHESYTNFKNIPFKSNKVLIKQINDDSPLHIGDLKEALYLHKRGFVLQYSSEDKSNLDLKINNDWVRSFNSQKNDYRHAIFCIGYDDNKFGKKKGAFLFRDSDIQSTHSGEIWISYDELKKKNIFDEYDIINDEVDGLAFDNDKTRANFLNKNKNFYFSGGSKEKIWWLSKSVSFLGIRRFYFINHFNFKITLLKFPYIKKKATTEVTVGVLNSSNKRIYSFKIKPKQIVVFSIENVSYEFNYKYNSWNRGKNKFYPEINYTIKQYEKTNQLNK